MWTVFITNFPSNLLLLCELNCWNSKEAITTGFSVSVAHLCSLFRTVLKAAALYLICFNVFLRCRISLLTSGVTFCLDTVNELSQPLRVFATGVGVTLHGDKVHMSRAHVY
jgi:hypothetical protein